VGQGRFPLRREKRNTTSADQGEEKGGDLSVPTVRKYFRKMKKALRVGERRRGKAVEPGFRINVPSKMTKKGTKSIRGVVIDDFKISRERKSDRAIKIDARHRKK